MSQKLVAQASLNGLFELIEIPGLGNVLSGGTTVPTDGVPGFGKSALFFDLDATAGAGIYINRGTITSCNFDALTGGVDLSTLTSTAAELNTMTGILATTAELNRAADVSTRVVDCTASTLAVTVADHDKKIITLNRAGGIAVTLPVPAGGEEFTFIVQTTFTGAASIKSTAGTQIMIGYAVLGNDSDNTTVMWQALAASTYDTIDLFGTANSTGGIAGQTIKIRGLSATRWHVEIFGDAAGTEATPFADTVA